MEYIFYSFFSFPSLILWAIFIYLFFSNRSISRRLHIIEDRIVKGEVSNAVINSSQTKTEIPKSPETMLANRLEKVDLFVPKNNMQSDNSGKFVAWLKDDWLMKLGAFLFIIGFGWFVSYAFANNWIGPIGRISIGIFAGIAIMSFGFWRMMKYPSQGAIFMALGAGMAMLTIFAGRSIYGFFTPVSAVAFDFIIISFIAFASYKFNVQYLAFLAQILAYVTPLLAVGQTNSVFLFSYLLFISIATLGLAAVTGWRNLISTSLLFVGLYSLPYIFAGGYSGGSMYFNDAPLILNFSYIFSLLYLFSGMVAVINKGVQDVQNEIVLAVLNGLFLFFWIYNIAPTEWIVLIFSFWAALFTISAFVAFYLSSEKAPFYAYGSVAVAFIGAATAVQLDGAILVIAFITEISLLVLSVLLLTKNTKAIFNTSMLFVIPAVMSLSSIARYSSSQEIFTQEFFVLFLMAVALVCTGRLISDSLDQEKNETIVNYAGAMVVFGTLYIVYLIWQMLHIWIISSPDMATLASLVIYTIFGLLAYFAGLYGNDMARRTYGAGLLGFVVVRLMIVDVWHMDLFGRVITFFAIGILLMSTAFLTKKKQHELPVNK